MKTTKVQILTSKELRTDIYYFGFPDHETKPISYNYPMHVILSEIDYDFSYPLMVYLWFGNIKPLENMMHDDVSYLNEKGIQIYLEEPTSSYCEDGVFRTRELDSILTYIKNNNLTNVTVHMCDYKCSEFYSYYTKFMKLITDDIYLRTNPPPPKSNIPTDNFTKKFINLNSRFTLHRNFTSAYMCTKSGYCSWNFTGAVDQLRNILIDVDQLDDMVDGRLLSGIEYLNENSPLVVDYPITRPIPIDQAQNVVLPKYCTYSPNLEKFYADVFCAVETESVYFNPTANFSEKTLRAIAFKKPFIVVGAVNTLEYLRSMGYKTFSNYWDESYDTESDHTLRLAKIFKVVDYIDSMSIDELHKLYNEMRPILEHNHALLYQTAPTPNKYDNFGSINSKLKQMLWINHNRYHIK